MKVKPSVIAKHPKRLENPDQPFISVGGKDLKKVQKKAWEAGWWPAEKRNGIMWFAPDEIEHVMLHGSSSDHHALANAVSHFRKAGLDI